MAAVDLDGYASRRATAAIVITGVLLIGLTLSRLRLRSSRSTSFYIRLVTWLVAGLVLGMRRRPPF